jgi:PAS domain S-box-containing protein
MKARISLRARIVMLVVVAIVPLFGMSIFRALHNADAEVERAKDDLRFAASLAAASQERVADSARQVLTLIAALPDIQAASHTDCDRYFSSLTQRLPEYANLGFIGLDGHTRCHALDSGRKAYLGDRPYFHHAIEQRRFVVGTYAVGRLANKPVLTYAQPVMDAAGKVTGVVFASFDLAEMARLINAVELPPGAALGVQDREGALLAGKPKLPINVGDKVRSPVLKEAVQSLSSGVREGLDGAGHHRLWAFMPSSPRPEAAVFVSVSMDRDLIVGPGHRQLWLELSVLGLVAFLGAWVAWMIGGSGIVGPAHQILYATRQLEQGHLGVRIPLQKARAAAEFDKIAASFNLMADSLEQRERDIETELARSRQAYATLELTVNSMQEGLMAVDTTGRLLLINDTASKLFAIDDMSLVLSPRWPERQGLFVPGTETLYAFDQLPLYLALQGESGGPLHILVRNAHETGGRLISCSYRPMRGPDSVVGALMVFSDITHVERLQLEQTRSYEQLREVQRKLLNAQRLGRIGNWELDLASGLLWWSDEVYELYGLARDQFDGRPDTVLGLVHPDDRADYTRLRDAAMRERLPLDVEYRIITPAGQIRWIHQIGESYTDAQGGGILRAGVVQDVTARKLAQQVAAQTTAMLRRTGEMAKIGGWEVVLKGMQPVWSDQVYRIYELEPGSPLSVEQAMACYAPEAQPALQTAARAAAEHGAAWDLELPLVTMKGRSIWVRTQGRALFQDGRVTRVVGALQDITEKHDSQEQLRLLGTSISRLNDIVMITETSPLEEPGPRIVFVNDAFERRTGYLREEVLGRSPRFLQGPNTQRAELDRIGAAMREMKPVRAELINYKKNGEEFWLDLDMVPIADDKGRFTHFVAIERDITKRKLAEQALVNSEQRYAALFESAPVAMWIVDTETLGMLAVNQVALHNYGYSREQFLRLGVADILSPAERAGLQQHVEKSSSGLMHRWQHVDRLGREFPVETLSRAITYLGRAARFVVAVNVAAQVRAENEVQAYLFTLQRAADATQAITAHRTLEATMQEAVDQVRAVVGAHQAVVSLTGRGGAMPAINTMSFSDHYANCRDFVRQAHGCGLSQAVCQTNSPMRLTQAELEAQPGWQPLAADHEGPPPMRGWLAVPLTGRHGENVGLLQLTDKYEGEFSLQDQYVAVELAQLASIAMENARLFEQVHQLNLGLEEKVAERTAALERQEALFRTLAEQAPQVIWNAEPGGRLTYANRQWYELMGGTPADWMGHKWLGAVHPDDLPDMLANWQSARETLAPYNGLRRVLASDGTYHVMSYRASPVLDEGGQVLFWVGIDADVTEIKAIEAALRLSNQELEAFSYSVSHDLRSPLNTVDGFSRLLAKQLAQGPSSDKLQHYLSRIQAGVAQMGRLIEDLLSLAQVSRMQLRQEIVDLSAIARDIADECRGRDPSREAEILIDDGLRVLGDSRLVRVVMENLIGNAWKFTSQRPRALIAVGQTKVDGGVTAFFVRDNGAGFDMAYADKLFNTFQRLHAVSEFPGTGVGLATVSRVIGRHRGQVWAESAPDQGATFFFTLPGAPPA